MGLNAHAITSVARIHGTLVNRMVISIAASAVASLIAGCAGINVRMPADRVKNEVFRYDCCDPGLAAGTKDMCKMAANARGHALVDAEGNTYLFEWSDCKVGEEPWRKGEEE